MLLRQRVVPVQPTPLGNHLECPAQAALGRLPFHHPETPPRPSPEVGKPSRPNDPGRLSRSEFVGEIWCGGRANGTNRVLSGCRVRPYLPNRFGSTSRTRRASSSQANPITKSSA